MRRLSAREDFIEFCRRESFKTYVSGESAASVFRVEVCCAGILHVMRTRGCLWEAVFSCKKCKGYLYPEDGGSRILCNVGSIIFIFVAIRTANTVSRQVKTRAAEYVFQPVLCSIHSHSRRTCCYGNLLLPAGNFHSSATHTPFTATKLNYHPTPSLNALCNCH
jgi:hypothetical protein